MIPQKPFIPVQLTRSVEKLDLRSTLILQGILLDHALQLMGMVPPTPKKSIIELPQ